MNAPFPFTDIERDQWLEGAWVMADGFLRQFAGPSGGLRLIFQDGRCLRAAHTLRGELPGLELSAGDTAETIGAREGAGAVAMIAADLPERIMQRLAAGLDPGQDLAGQAAAVFRAAAAELGGAVQLWPQPPVREPRYAAINTAARALPAGELVMGVLYDDRADPRILCSGIARLNRRPQLDLYATTAGLPGLSVRDWRRDYAAVNEAARARFGKVFFAAHLPVSVMPELFEAGIDRRLPAALLELHSARRIILDPFPLRLRALLKMGKLF